MCLAIPGKILSITDDCDLQRQGIVAFGDLEQEINLSFVPDAVVGDYVIVHVGFAISKLNEAEAQRVFELIEPIDGKSS